MISPSFFETRICWYKLILNAIPNMLADFFFLDWKSDSPVLSPSLPRNPNSKSPANLGPLSGKIGNHPKAKTAEIGDREDTTRL
jgi:hypothetical protein